MPSRLRFSTKCMIEGVWMPVCGKPPSHGFPVAERFAAMIHA